MKFENTNTIDVTAIVDFVSTHPAPAMSIASLCLMALCWIAKDYI